MPSSPRQQKVNAPERSKTGTSKSASLEWKMCGGCGWYAASCASPGSNTYWLGSFVRNKLGLDPVQIWFDFCKETPESKQACQAFLRSYVKASKYQRLTLGPEEFEGAYRITCPDSVNTMWKALIAEADEKILKPARIAAMKDKELGDQVRFWRLKRGKHGAGAHDEGPVSAVSNV